MWETGMAAGPTPLTSQLSPQAPWEPWPASEDRFPAALRTHQDMGTLNTWAHRHFRSR